MKFEHRGKWLEEAEEKLTFDKAEKPDYLNGDKEVLTFEDADELDGDLIDEVESDEEPTQANEDSRKHITVTYTRPVKHTLFIEEKGGKFFGTLNGDGVYANVGPFATEKDLLKEVEKNIRRAYPSMQNFKAESSQKS